MMDIRYNIKKLNHVVLIMNQTERYHQAKKVTLWGAFINALLAIIKCVGGFFFHSQALIADGIHSLSDLLSDSLVLMASKYGSQEADASHPYGHQRIETAATLFLALLLIVAGIGIAWDAVRHIILKDVLTPEIYAVPIAVISILANEILFHYTKYIGIKIQSELITANAWHHRSDAASSVIVLLGLLGGLFGFQYVDSIAAIVVGGMILKMGIDYGWNSTKELVDTAVESQQLKTMEKIIKDVNGVVRIHQLRSRMMGGDIYVDVHILVAPKISVSEGHFIAQKVHHRLMSQIDPIKDVTVHVDPEDDEEVSPSLHLPERAEIEETLIHQWQIAHPEITSWTIHYLDGKIEIVLLCDHATIQEHELKSTIQNALNTTDHIRFVRIHYNAFEISSPKAP